MSKELEYYLSRVELEHLTSHKKQLLRRYVRIYGGGYPVERPLALGLMKLNTRYSFEYVRQDFINWLYYY